MKPQAIIRQLAAFDGRLDKGEAVAAELLCKMLDKRSIAYSLQPFTTATPRFIEYSLTADYQPIECLPSGLKSGEITNAYNLISSLTSSQKFIDTPNINFNPKSDAICLCNFYFAPALAISRRDVPKIMQATRVTGVLKVEPKPYTTNNILVGNAKNPTTVVFAHYDAYFSGATDNASGVAVCMSLLIDKPALLKTTLFVLAGNEELSYDYPIYWGRCFREFNRTLPELLAGAKKIVVVDSVGDGPPQAEVDPALLNLAFPIGNEPAIIAKSMVVTGDFDALMGVYHSALDTPARLDDKLLDSTIKFIQQQLI